MGITRDSGSGRRRLARFGALIMFALGALALPATALAATRYASPTGTGPSGAGQCVEANPCSLEGAVEDPSVQDGDEVIVLPGAYDLGTGFLQVDNQINLHGAAGGSRPQVTASGGASTLFSFGTANFTVRDLEFKNTGSGGALQVFGQTGLGATAERIVATAQNSTAYACALDDVVIRDSLCVNSAGRAAGINSGSTFPHSTALRNVTALSLGGTAPAIDVEAGGAGHNMTWDAKNVIARGPTTDVRAAQSGGATLAITLANSNYEIESESGGATVTPSTAPTNQEADPVFVNAAGGNFHEAPSSPTIDAGAVDGLNGTVDLDGDQRSIDGNCDGAAEPDIGADEFNVPCNDDFADAQTISGSAASVNGSNVNATQEASEPNYCTEDVCGNNVTVTRSVWYRWTSPGDGPAAIGTCTANYDSMLAVFTGSDLASLTPVVANNNSADCPPSTFGSKVSFDATAGTTYHVLVDGCCGAPQGTFTLELTGPEAPPPPPPPPDGDGGDTEPPDTTITRQPKDKTKNKQATFEFSSSEPGSSFQCAVDGQTLKVPCTSPYTVKVKKGKHTFRVRATDSAGNADATPASDSWKVKKKK
jgi:hypothetical protein